jgi:hypothetical protein
MMAQRTGNTGIWSKSRDRFANSVWRVSTASNKSVRKSKEMKWSIRGMVTWSTDYLKNTANSKKQPIEMRKAAKYILANRGSSRLPKPRKSDYMPYDGEGYLGAMKAYNSKKRKQR